MSGARQEERGKWVPLESPPMANGVLEICFEYTVMLGAKSMLLMAVFFIVIALLLCPTVLFLTNERLMKRTVNRAAKP